MNMKKTISLLILSVFIISCSPVEVNSSKLVKRKGITYEINKEVPFTGRSVEYSNFNNIKLSEGNYKDGLKDGLWIQWLRNGSGAKIAESRYKDGKKHGLWARWWDSGQKYSEENYKDGLKDGLWVGWQANGEVHEKGRYIDGHKDGPWIDFIFQGKAVERHYTNGKKDGTKKTNKKLPKAFKNLKNMDDITPEEAEKAMAEMMKGLGVFSKQHAEEMKKQEAKSNSDARN